MIREKLRGAILGISALLLSSCATVDSRVYMPEQIKTVSSWFLEFSYEAGEVERLEKSTGDSEVKVLKKGQTDVDLQLQDDLYFVLRDEYAVSFTKNPAEATGRIQIHPIHFYNGGFQLLTVTLVDKQGETLARLKIKNGDRNATYQENDDFTLYAAEAIAKALNKKPTEF